MQVGPTWNGAPVTGTFDVPSNVALVDSVWFGQAAFLDLGGTPSGSEVALTNGLRIELGAP